MIIDYDNGDHGDMIMIMMIMIMMIVIMMIMIIMIMMLIMMIMIMITMIMIIMMLVIMIMIMMIMIMMIMIMMIITLMMIISFSGLDNCCTLYNVSLIENEESRPHTVATHLSHVTCCSFTKSDHQVRILSYIKK